MTALTLRLAVPVQSIDDIEKIEEAVDTSALTSRDVAAAAIIFAASCVLAWVLGLAAKHVMRRFTDAPEYVDQLIGRLVRSVTVFVGFATALERLGVDVGWFAVIIALVGVVIVLMIRPLVENGASGLLLTSRPSFSVGDDIETNGHRGEVITINGRSTVIQTRDHRRVHIPNTDVLDNPITVYTAYPGRRSQLDLEVAYDSDIDEVSRLLIEAASGVDGVLEEPAPSTRLRGFGTGTVIVRLRWWHDSHLGADGKSLDGVVREVKRVVDAAGVDMPSPELIVRQPDRAGGADPA